MKLIIGDWYITVDCTAGKNVWWQNKAYMFFHQIQHMTSSVKVRHFPICFIMIMNFDRLYLSVYLFIFTYSF